LLSCLCLIVNISLSSKDNVYVEVFYVLRKVSLILLAVVIVIFFIDPNVVSSYYMRGSGTRLLGGSVAPVPVLSLIVFVISLYYLFMGIGSAKKSYLFLTIGLFFLILSRTRSAYYSAIFSSLCILFIKIKHLKRTSGSYLFVSVVVIVVLLLVFYIYSDFDNILYMLLRGADYSDIRSLTSGRNIIFEWVFDRILEKPYGLGYISGFRMHFLPICSSLGFRENGIGNAHNSFLEILIGGGWHSLILFLCFPFLAFYNYRYVGKIVYDRRFIDVFHGKNIASILLGCLIIMSFTASDFVIPAKASFGIFWAILFVSLSLKMRTGKLAQESLGRA